MGLPVPSAGVGERSRDAHRRFADITSSTAARQTAAPRPRLGPAEAGLDRPQAAGGAEAPGDRRVGLAVAVRGPGDPGPGHGSRSGAPDRGSVISGADFALLVEVLASRSRAARTRTAACWRGLRRSRRARSRSRSTASAGMAIEIECITTAASAKPGGRNRAGNRSLIRTLIQSIRTELPSARTKPSPARDETRPARRKPYAGGSPKRRTSLRSESGSMPISPLRISKCAAIEALVSSGSARATASQ